MQLPDCRHDDYYNEDFLTNDRHEFVRGYDWATEAVDNLFDNIDSLTDGSDHIEKFFEEELPEHMKSEYAMHYTFPEHYEEKREAVTYGDFLRMKMLEWLERNRDELITSMIDDMSRDEDLYNAIRNKVLKDNAKSDFPKEYYDTKKYAVTGIKESGESIKE